MQAEAERAYTCLPTPNTDTALLTMSPASVYYQAIATGVESSPSRSQCGVTGRKVLASASLVLLQRRLTCVRLAGGQAR